MEDWMEDWIVPRATQPADTQAGYSKHPAQATPMGLLRTLCADAVHEKALFHGQKASQMAAVHRNGGFCGQNASPPDFMLERRYYQKGFPIAVGNDGGD